MLFVSVVLLLLLTPSAGATQAVTFARGDVEYQLELPSDRWRAVERLDVHRHFEFIRDGDRRSGYLRIRKHLVDVGMTPKDLFRRDQSTMLKFLPGFIECAVCDGEEFAGSLSGAVFSYEFTSGGRLMSGRIYYLRIDARTYYTLHFTCDGKKFSEASAEVDLIARSFRLR